MEGSLGGRGGEAGPSEPVSKGVRAAVGGHARSAVTSLPSLASRGRQSPRVRGLGHPGFGSLTRLEEPRRLSPALLQPSRPGGCPFPSRSARGAGQRGASRRASCDLVSESTPCRLSCSASWKQVAESSPPSRRGPSLPSDGAGPRCGAQRTLCRSAPGPGWGGAAAGGAAAGGAAGLRRAGAGVGRARLKALAGLGVRAQKATFRAATSRVAFPPTG